MIFLDASLPPANAAIGVSIFVIGVLAIILSINAIVIFAVYIHYKRQKKKENNDR